MVAAKTVSWEVFRTQLVNHLGVKRAQAIYCEQTNYPSSTLYYWKKLDEVPVEAFERIADIEIGACDTTRFKGYHTKKFFNRVVELSNENLPIKRIAAILTEEMGRKVTEGAVKSARFREKDRIAGYRTRGVDS